jgi:hypothetical protein
MPVLDPRNLDVADLLSLIRDIADRLDCIDEHLDHADDRLGDIDANIHAVEIVLAREPGHDRGVAAAVNATIADLHDRHSLIPVADDDEYEDHCIGCLLKKNGYPSLAAVVNAVGSHDEEA